MTATVDRTMRAAPADVGFFVVVFAIARRGLQRVVRIPALMLPALLMPVFFVVAFSGSFSSAVQVEGYGTNEAVNWMAAWAVMQGAAFAGVGAAGAAATDLENGFFDRLLLAPVKPLAIVTGLVMYGQARSLVPTTLVLIVAVLLGADLPGGVPGVVALYVAGIGVATFISLFGLVVAFRLRTTRSLSLIQIAIFSFMFLSIGQAPLVAIEGWLHHVARINPMTNILRLARQGFLGDIGWSTTWPGLVAIASLCAVFGLFAWRGVARLRP
ncbi:MAG: ABC transporter permease [Acidimicrobiia bacterium]|nr:ABC transporter permease [Acidimicrobiia bacterium]